MRRPLLVVSTVAGALAAIAAAATPAGADVTSWSADPGHGDPGVSVQVASAADGDCTWLQPSEPDGGDLVEYDGTRVDLELRDAGLRIPLGSLTVESGGTWSGSVTVPAETVPGSYELVPTCVVDQPALDGVRSFELDHRTFMVDAPPGPADVGPPPAIITAPTVAPPAAPAASRSAAPGRRVASVARTRPQLPNTGPGGAAMTTLPNTGRGTVPVALAGVGALGMGALAIWWGQRRPHASRGPAIPDAPRG